MKLNDIKEKKVKIELLDGIHECVFDMNAIAEIEEIYGDYQTGVNQFSVKPNGALRAFVYAMLKADDEDLTLSKIGKLIPIDRDNLEKIMKAINEAINSATKNNDIDVIEEEEEEKDPNVQ